MGVKGTQTEKNLLKSFAGESQARNRYDFAAKVAAKEGYEKVRLIFEETALQEQMHAKRFFSYLESGEALEITAMYPAGKLGTTLENLKEAAMGEHEEHTELYPEFAKVAQSEGFSEISMLWKNVAVAEKHHEERFNALLQQVESGSMFKSPSKVVWRCLKCGFVVESNEPPAKCPACQHPQSWYEIINTNW